MKSPTLQPTDGLSVLGNSPDFSLVGRARLDSECPSACHSGLTKDFSNKRRRYPHLVQHTLLVAAFAIGVGCLIDASNASAAETAASQGQMKVFPVAQIFTFLLLMLGPFKIIGPFSKLTKGADAQLSRVIALWSTLFSSLALLFAGLLGETILLKYGIPLPVLALSAGIILFLVALQNILQQFTLPASHGEKPAGPTSPPTINMALSPLAFPTIVTPYGISALIVFLAFSPDLQGRLIIGAIVVAIMLLNLIAMIVTRHIPRSLSVLLSILGAVLSVVQVALGLQIINNSLKALGAL